MHWYIDVLKNYVGFSGRARRTEFWMFALISFVVATVLTIVENLVGVPGTLSSLYNLAVLLPSLAVAMRRLHDTGRSGFWLLLIFIPVLGWLVLLIFYILEGTSGDNEYGPDPKAVAA